MILQKITGKVAAKIIPLIHRAERAIEEGNLREAHELYQEMDRLQHTLK